MSADLFDRLRAEGFAVIEQMVADGEEETLHLEFKEMPNPAATKLDRDDKKLIAKAVSGMANAEGGTIILGIKSGKAHGVDVACEVKSLADAETMRRRIVAAMPDLLSYQHSTIEVATVRADGPAGVVAIRVPPSDRRPHMSIPHWGYFRRGSDGTRLMTHGEVRDLMLGERAGSLAVRFDIGGTSTYGRERVKSFIRILLENDGNVPVWAPYALIDGGRAIVSDAARDFVVRLHDGRTGVYGSRNIMIPPGDRIVIALVSVGLVLHPNTPSSFEEASAFLRREPRAGIINDSASNWDPHLFEIVPEFAVAFGGANAARCEASMPFDRESLKHELLKLRARSP